MACRCRYLLRGSLGELWPFLISWRNPKGKFKLGPWTHFLDKRFKIAGGQNYNRSYRLSISAADAVINFGLGPGKFP